MSREARDPRDPRAFPKAAPAWRRHLRFWRPDIHADTDEELRLHLESRVEELVSGGMLPDAARAQALTEFGDVAQYRRLLRDIDQRIDVRRSRGELLSALIDDVRYSTRSLFRAKGFVATVVVTMALGLGVNAAMFTFLDDVFFRPPAGVAAPSDVRRFWLQHFNTHDNTPFASLNVSWPIYTRYMDAGAGGATTAAYVGPEKARLGHGEGAPTAMVSSTTTNYLAVTGARLARGRWFTDAENAFGAAASVAVVSQAFVDRVLADSVFADGGTALGRVITVDGVTTTIIGVAADGFVGPDLDAVDVWKPIATLDDRGPSGEPWWQTESFFGLRTISRLAPGASEQAIAARATAAERVAQGAMPYGDTLETVSLGPIVAARGPGTRAPEVMVATRLAAVALIVLLIACANVINLLLARAALRRKEIAIRLSLGISRARLIRLMTTESLLITLVAGAAALGAASWGGTLMRKLLLPATQWGHPPVGMRLVVFTTAASIVAGLVIGLVPALRASRPDLTASLRGAGHDASPQRSRLRSSLVAMQAALAMVLLVSALLFVASLRKVKGLDIGFDAPRLIFASVTFETAPPNAAVLRKQGYDQLAAEIAAAPGVQSVALASSDPMRGFGAVSFYFGADSLMSLPRGSRPTYTAVSESYFRTVGLRLLRGDAFDAHRGESTVVVNEAMARAMWHDANPIGQCIRFMTRDAPCTIVTGVVVNARLSKVIEAAPSPQFYLPLGALARNSFGTARTVIVRADPSSAPLVIAALRERLRAIFPGGEPRVKRMVEYLEPDYRPYRLGASLFTALGVLAFVVALVGIYSTVSYSVQQRTKEFSIRTALGAQMRDVLLLVVGEELRVVLAGVAIGAVLVFAGGGLIASLLYGVAPRNITILISVGAMLLAASVVGSLLPAWRAGRVDPARTLRSE